MYVVIHQAPRKALYAMRRASLRYQPEICAPVIVAEKHRQPTIAALGDMMRNTGYHYTS
jgi:hypothetical protein